MRILVATDAWRPQVNGVVRTYERLAESLPALSVEIDFLTPSEFRSLPCPTYPEINLALPGWGYVTKRLATLNPDAIHIATEGPVGWMTRAYCKHHSIPFTTSYHTRFPEYLKSRLGIPAGITWAAQKCFHNAGSGLMVATPSLAKELESRGFINIQSWTRGVDTALFHPSPERVFGDGPVFLYVGRVSVEKNIEVFLNLDLPGRKVVVGDGPELERLKFTYPSVEFTGKQTGKALATSYASADVFVFPSRTDTFGIVLLEAMASGLPVAAFPVTGPIDIVQDGKTGILSDDLKNGALTALHIDRNFVRQTSLKFNWDSAARQFVTNIEAVLHAKGKAKSQRQLLTHKTNSA